MKTRKIYVCGIGEVLSIAPTVFKGVNKVLYRVHEKIRLAKLVHDKLTGEKRYKLLVNGLEVNEGFDHAKEIGELFVIAPYEPAYVAGGTRADKQENEAEGPAAL